ncbi:MAG: protein kinase [Isosphaeraceae bacterium]|nr:protein kinase [Isosphaeraceae bacterium]
MPGDDLEELLDRWEEAQDRGEPVAPEDLCRERPELLPELIQRIQELREADAFFGTTGDVVWARTLSLDSESGEAAELGPPTAQEERYTEERFLAEGGLGRVFVARDAELPRDVALKRLQDRLLRSRESRLRFVLEAEITARLEHPGVVPVYGLGVDRQGQPFYAMRLIRGETMARAIERFHEADAPGRDPGARGVALQGLLRAFLTACQTIAYAHSRGIIHRDIKPANVMLGEYGETLVVDWGLAKPIGARSDEPAGDIRRARAIEETTAGAVKGSPVYMSPEQAAGRWDEVGPASDVYALGATLYTLLSGTRPFDGKTVSEVLARVRAGEFPPPRRVKAGVPRALEAVCLKAMSLRAADRYATALDLASDVERWLSGEPVRAWREPWPDRLRRWARRHRVLVASVVAALVVGAAILAVTNGRLRSLAHRLDQSNQTLDKTNKRLATALDAAESNLYARDLDLADRAWWDAEPALAARYLDECPAPRRGWEWRYLVRRNEPGVFHSALVEPPLLLGFTGDGIRIVVVEPHGVSAREAATGRASALPSLPPSTIRHAALSPDGTRLAVVQEGRPDALTVLDLQGRIAPDPVTAGVPGAVEALAFAPDGKRLVLVVAQRGEPDPGAKEKLSFRTEFEGRLVVRDPASGRGTVSDPFASSGVPGPPIVAPDGVVLCPVFFGEAGFLYAMRPDATQVERTWPRAGDEDNMGHGLVVAADGLRVATWGDDRAVTIREVTSGQVVATFRGHSEAVRCAAFSSDGARLATGADDRTVRVWDVARGEPRAVLRGHTAGVTGLAFSSDGSRLVSVAADGLIAWDATSGSEAQVVREPEHAHLADLAIGQGERVAVAAGHRVSWRDGATGRAVGGADEEIEADVVAASPLAPSTAAGLSDGRIALFDADSRRVGDLRGHRRRIVALAFSRDGRRLASAGDHEAVRVWDVAGRQELAALPTGSQESEVSVSAVALSPDGTMVAYGSDGPDVIVHAVGSRDVVRRLGRAGASVRRLEFSPDGGRLLVVRSSGPGPQREGGGLAVWDVATGTLLFGSDEHPGAVTDAAFSPDGLRLASADRTGQVRIQEAAGGRFLLTLRGPAGPIARLAFSPDGHRLFAAGGRVDPLVRRSEETAELTIWHARPIGNGL